MREIKYNEAINEALKICMKRDKSVIVMGLGVDDPKRIFGTTNDLEKISKFKRMFDMPTAENSNTGIAIGLAISGIKPIITHQRVEFSLLAMEQIINQAAKWSYMSAGLMHVPLVIRLIIGKGWGQGPQHSQSLESLFANIPGLKVVSPSSAYDAKGLLIASIEDKNPIIFFEHRWLHETSSFVPKKYYKIALGKAKILQRGKDITIVSNSFMTVEVLKAKNILHQMDINPEIIDLRSIRPLDKRLIINSVKKTGRLLVIDNGWQTCGVSAEIISVVSESIFYELKSKPMRIGIIDTPIPSTRSLSKYCYPSYKEIVENIMKILKINKKKFNKNIKNNFFTKFDDIPNDEFSGPF